MSEPATEAGRRLLDAIIADLQEQAPGDPTVPQAIADFTECILAIEQEARADLAAAIPEADTTDLSGGTFQWGYRAGWNACRAAIRGGREVTAERDRLVGHRVAIRVVGPAAPPFQFGHRYRVVEMRAEVQAERDEPDEWVVYFDSLPDLDVERLARALQRVTEEEPGLLSDVDMLNDPTEGDPRSDGCSSGRRVITAAGRRRSGWITLSRSRWAALTT